MHIVIGSRNPYSNQKQQAKFGLTLKIRISNLLILILASESSN